MPHFPALIQNDNLPLISPTAGSMARRMATAEAIGVRSPLPLHAARYSLLSLGHWQVDEAGLVR
jgi:hypothetical protein